MTRKSGSRAGESRRKGPKHVEESEWEGNSGDSDSANEDPLHGEEAKPSTQASASTQSAPKPEDAPRHIYKFRANARKLKTIIADEDGAEAPEPTKDDDKEITPRPQQNINTAAANTAAATATKPSTASATSRNDVPVVSTRPTTKSKASAYSTTSNNVPAARAPTTTKPKASASSTTGNYVPVARTSTATKPGASSFTINNSVPTIGAPSMNAPGTNATVARARSDGNHLSNALAAAAAAAAPSPASPVPAAPETAAATGFFTPSAAQGDDSEDGSLPTVNLASEDGSRAGLEKNQYRGDDGDIVTCPVGTCFSQDTRDWPRNMYHTAEEYIRHGVNTGSADDREDRQYLLGVQSGIGQGVAMLKRLLLREYALTGRLWNLPVEFQTFGGAAVPAARAAVVDLIASGDIVEMMAAMDAGNQSIMLHHGGREAHADGSGDDDSGDDDSGDDDDDDEADDDGEGADESDDEFDSDDVVGDNVNIATSDAAPARPGPPPGPTEYVSPAAVGGLVPGQLLPVAPRVLMPGVPAPTPFFGVGEYGANRHRFPEEQKKRKHK